MADLTSGDPLKMGRLADVMHAVLRISTALTFISHGTMKHLGLPPTPPNGPPAFPPLLSLSGVAGVLEIVGGILVLIGLFTRPVAFLLSGMMAFAYWSVHAPHGFAPAINGGEPAYLFCFVFLFLSAAGAGPWSVDAARRGAANA